MKKTRTLAASATLMLFTPAIQAGEIFSSDDLNIATLHKRTTADGPVVGIR